MTISCTMDSMEVLCMVLYSITCVLGIPGNALVIWIAGVKMKTTVTTIWYVNLAVADLFSCLTIPLSMTWLVLDYWPYGAAMCKILPAVAGFNMFACMFTLMLITLDRFTLVIWPVWAQDHKSIFGARLLCGLAWFLALLLSLPSLVYREIILTTNNKTDCDYGVNNSSIKAGRVCRFLFGFLVPLLVIIVCYLLIARKVSIEWFKSTKSLRIMVGVVTAFFVCWMPYHILGLVIKYGETRSAEVARGLYPLAKSVAYISSCLNPVLYVFMGQEFKERVRVSLHRIFANAFNEDAT